MKKNDINNFNKRISLQYVNSGYVFSYNENIHNLILIANDFRIIHIRAKIFPDRTVGLSPLEGLLILNKYGTNFSYALVQAFRFQTHPST